MNFHSYFFAFKIDIAETYLFWCLKYNKNHPLLQNLETEQLPKLKSKFSLPSTPNNEKKKLIEKQNESRFIHPMMYTHSVSQQSLSGESTPTKKHSISEISNQSREKANSSISTNSHRKQPFLAKVTNSSIQRDSVSSIRSNSDEETRNKFILDEQINPIRPLRPKTQTSSTSTGSNSAHNSRPVSHVSDDGQLTLLPMNSSTEVNLNFCSNNSNSSSRNNIHDEASILATSTPGPPPKPPKPLNISLNLIKKAKQQTPDSNEK